MSLTAGLIPSADTGDTGDDPTSGIDMDFLAGVEGRKLQGYKDRGGVAVGTGFNIGQHTSEDVQNLFADTPNLVRKLAPYAASPTRRRSTAFSRSCRST